MIKDKTLTLKDYRIIRIMLTGEKPLEHIKEIGLPDTEIKERIERMKIIIPELYKLNTTKCNEM